MASNSSYYIYIKNVKQENKKTTSEGKIFELTLGQFRYFPYLCTRNSLRHFGRRAKSRKNDYEKKDGSVAQLDRATAF